MKCPKCNCKIYFDDKYCVRCGYQFFKDKEINEKELFQEEMIDLYINRRIVSQYSIFYLFFNWFYLFYKKMYYEGVISFFAANIFFSILKVIFFTEMLSYNFFLYFFLLITTGYILYFYFSNCNFLYIEKCEKTISRLFLDNKDKSKDEIRILVKKLIKLDKIKFYIFSIVTLFFTLLIYI